MRVICASHTAVANTFHRHAAGRLGTGNTRGGGAAPGPVEVTVGAAYGAGFAVIGVGGLAVEVAAYLDLLALFEFAVNP